MPWINRIKKLALVAPLILPMGCAETAETINENQYEIGAPLFAGSSGWVAGSVIGSTAAEAGLGAAGLVAGAVAAPYLKKRDVNYFDKAINAAAVATPGKAIEWHNPNTGTTGQMTRERDVDLFAAKTCRALRSVVTSDGTISTEDLVVCRDEFSPWYIQSAELMERRPVQ